jgi:hypothetical protein
MDHTAWSRLQHTLLGKTILFTDQEGWSAEAIVRRAAGRLWVCPGFRKPLA